VDFRRDRWNWQKGQLAIHFSLAKAIGLNPDFHGLGRQLCVLVLCDPDTAHPTTHFAYRL
jgi:hypothetical protein